MAIPDSIKAVERPTNSRVKNINGKYIVIARTSVRFNGRSIPIELGTIGEIIDGKYVAYPNPNVRDAAEARNAYKKRHSINEENSVDVENDNVCTQSKAGRKKKATEYTIKTSGPIDLINNLENGLLQELTDIFGIADAKFIYLIALLRTAFGEIKNRDLDEEYEGSMASVIYPGVALSEKTVSTTLKRLGYNTLAMIKFWRNRVKTTIEHGVVIVDGSLLDFNSQGSIYSEFSRKGKTKGSKDALVLTAYSLELQEPICEELYPGNMLDMVAYKEFSEKYGLDNAVVVARPVNDEEDLHAVIEEEDENGKKKKVKKLVDVKLFDKGYSSEEVVSRLRDGGHYFIVAIKNDRSEITDYELDNPCEYLKEYKEDIVMYKKIQVAENKFFYSFKCPRMGQIQNSTYVKNEVKNNRFSPEKYNSKQSTFGLIVFESNLDLTPYEIYSAYDDRWKIEPYEKLRKSIMDNDSINVHSDPSARTTIFISAISNILACRLRKLMKETGMSKKYSTKEILRKMQHFMKQQDEDGNWQPTSKIKKIDAVAKVLGVV